MTTDVLDRLAEVAVPPVPAHRSFVVGVRRKLNPRLLAAQILGFVVGATSWAVPHMAVAVLAAVRYTVTGSWPDAKRRGARGDVR